MKNHSAYILSTAVGALVVLCGMSSMAEQGRRARVENVFKALDVCERDNESQKELIASSFNLDDSDVSTLMLKAINRFANKRGEATAKTAIACIVSADPVKGLEWLMDNYTNFTAIGRANMLQGLRHQNQAETYEIVFSCLDDRSMVADMRAFRLCPGPYRHLRVCDYACNTLRYMLLSSRSQTKGEVPHRIHSSTKIVDRNKIVDAWRKWWKTKGPAVLKRKEALSEKAPGLKDKITILRQKIKASAKQ